MEYLHLLGQYEGQAWLAEIIELQYYLDGITLKGPTVTIVAMRHITLQTRTTGKKFSLSIKYGYF